MRTIIVCFALFAGGALLLPQSGIGIAVSGTEAALVYGGDCTQNALGSKVTLCFGGSCSSDGCGCTTRMPWTSGKTGGKPDPATSCGTSHCTALQSFSGACAG